MEKSEEERTKAFPKSELFKIHDCELELDPVRNCFKPPVWRITHGVFFFGIGKDPFNGSASQRVGGFAEF